MSESVRWSVEHLVREAHALFGFGSLSGAGPPAVSARLTLNFRSGPSQDVTVSLSHAHGRTSVRQDAATGPWSAGFVIIAGWTSEPPVGASLACTLADGSVKRVPLALPHAQAAAGQKPYPGQLPSQRFVHSVARLAAGATRPARLRCRQWRRAARLRRWLKPKDAGHARGVTLLIDHSMGGGANQWRDCFVNSRRSMGEALALLTYDLHQLAYIVDGRAPAGHSKRLVFRELEDLEAVLNRIPIRDIIYSCAVSFPRAIEACRLARRLADRHSARVQVFIHDYFVACPSAFLIDHRGEHCRIPGLDQCRSCLARHSDGFVSIAGCRSIDQWRESWGGLLGASYRIVCFSESSRRLLSRAYPHVTERILVRPHEIVPLRRVSTAPILKEGPLVLGVIGSIAHHKGAGVVQQLAREIESTCAPVKVVVIGQLQADSRCEAITVTGPYDRGALPEIVERMGIQLVLFPSICPETFSYVAHEVMSMGLPMVTLDVGAPADLVRTSGLGRVATRSDGPGLLREILEYACDLDCRPVTGA